MSRRFVSALFLLQLFAFAEGQSTSSPTTVRSPDTVLRMLGPMALRPGKKDQVKTDYFDPRTYDSSNVRDFYRLAKGMNAAMRNLAEESARVRREAETEREQMALQVSVLRTAVAGMALALALLAVGNLLMACRLLQQRKLHRQQVVSL